MSLIHQTAMHDMEMFLRGLGHARNEWKRQGAAAFSSRQLKRFSLRYDELIAQGYEANKGTRGRLAKKEEKALLNRLVKYKANHLLFLYDFRVHYSNNMSEKDLRMCKNRDKMAGGFRSASGRDMYCRDHELHRNRNAPGYEYLPKHHGSYERQTSYTVTGLFVVL